MRLSFPIFLSLFSSFFIFVCLLLFLSFFLSLFFVFWLLLLFFCLSLSLSSFFLFFVIYQCYFFFLHLSIYDYDLWLFMITLLSLYACRNLRSKKQVIHNSIIHNDTQFSLFFNSQNEDDIERSSLLLWF